MCGGLGTGWRHRVDENSRVRTELDEERLLRLKERKALGKGSVSLQVLVTEPLKTVT